MNNVLNFLKSLNINKSEYVVVACSGGPDSMFLLDLLVRLDYKVVCAHVNHKVRLESDDEYKFVADYCNNHKIMFEGVELSGYVCGNFENYARNFRYSFFENVLKKYNSKYLFTAHHGDDLIETIMMRIVRGSSLRGYKGFSLVSERNFYKVIRPLIYLTKDMIVDYNDENNIKYVIDNSNYSDDYTRNRFRKYVLPFLKDEDALVHEKFILFSEELDESVKYVDRVVDNFFKEIYVDNSLDINKFVKLDRYIQKCILYKIFSILYPDNLYLVDGNHINELLKIIYSPKPNINMILPNNITVVKSYDVLCFDIVRESLTYNEEYYDGISINNWIFRSTNTSSTSNYVIRLSSKDIKLPIYIRTRRNGDKMQVKNMVGTKKVNDIFIDNKIEKLKRDNWPIMVDANDTILWVPGLKKSDFDIPIDGEYDIIVEYLEKERNYE